MPSTDEQLKRLVEQLQQMPGIEATLPGDHGAEVGGLGSDTDPGVTGRLRRYGFGAIGNDGPIPVPGELDE